MLPRLPVLEGQVTTIDIQKGCYDLGVSIVGGCDTPLVCVVIQEVFPDGAVHKDGRLQPGDQILEVNGVDLTAATHLDAWQALKQPYPICRLTVYREKAEENSTPIEKEEIIKVSLPKVHGKQLGIKLVGKKNGPGIYILDMIPGGLAALDNRLKRDDRILEINGQDITSGTQELAAHLIQASVDRVQVVVSRKSQTQTQDIILHPSASKDGFATLSRFAGKDGTVRLMPPVCKEKLISVHKDPLESLGMSVAGGIGSPRGDIPIYVTNIQITGCLGRSKQIKKGDVVLSVNGQSLLNLTHSDAVHVLKTQAEHKVVSLRILVGTETTDSISNFNPTWRFWLSMLPICHVVRKINLSRASSGTLGFSIVGGCDSIHGPHPIYIKSIVPNTPAGKDGRLQAGDMLLAVNGHSLRNIPHGQAVTILKTVKGEVTLQVVSWPGTLV